MRNICIRFSDILMRFTRGVLWKVGGSKHHRGRVGEALREEIETLVEGESADPRIRLVSVTSVHVAVMGARRKFGSTSRATIPTLIRVSKVLKRLVNIFVTNWWSDCAFGVRPNCISAWIELNRTKRGWKNCCNAPGKGEPRKESGGEKA